MRAVADPNVLISAALSSGGTPAEVVRRWLDGAVELVASDALIDELARALAYAKLRRRISAEEAVALVALIRGAALFSHDPVDSPTVRSVDSDDDYLIALAEVTGSALVSGDAHLRDLSDRIPVYSPAQFIALLDG